MDWLVFRLGQSGGVAVFQNKFPHFPCMKLKQFVIAADGSVNQRGLNYYLESRIAYFSEYVQDNWVAEVFGTDNYHLELELKGEEVTSWSCDCPYDLGEICKHLIALGHAILEEKERRQFAETHQVNQKMLSMPSFAEIVGATGAEFEKADLEKFIAEYGKHRSDFRAAFQEWFVKK